VNLQPVLAASVGIAIYRGIVSPLIERYLAWKSGPRVQVARRNWRGVYVPDLHVKRPSGSSGSLTSASWY
jgi:hypothetical protein